MKVSGSATCTTVFQLRTLSHCSLHHLELEGLNCRWNSSTLQGYYIAGRFTWIATDIHKATERIGGPRANSKSGASQNGLCEGGLGTHPQEILHALKGVLGAPEALFRACTQYIYVYTCKSLSSISGFRSKSTTYGALASRLRRSHTR